MIFRKEKEGRTSLKLPRGSRGREPGDAGDAG